MTVPYSDFSEMMPVERMRSPVYGRFGKRLVDLTAVLLMAPVVVPVLALILCATWIQGGKPLYIQKRVGRGGRIFHCWKVRTMVQNAEKVLADLIAADETVAREWHENQKLAKDPRITRLGRFLRRSSLDELPQLWNVVNGTMSLIGPRPFMPEQAPLYANGCHEAAYYQLRPGISGLWQVSRRNAGSFSERVNFDQQYAESLSLGADVAILWRTVAVVLRATGL